MTTRVNLGGGRWFSLESATVWEEARRWDGNNMVSVATGSQWEHERLYLTAKGAWVLYSWSQQWQGTLGRYTVIPESVASEWLVDNGHAALMSNPKYFYSKVLNSVSGYVTHAFYVYRTTDHSDLHTILEGTVDNKAGYGSVEAAQRIATQCRLLSGEGYSKVVSGDYLCQIVCQEYGPAVNDDWCRARFDINCYDLQRATEALRLVKKLTKALGREMSAKALQAWLDRRGTEVMRDVSYDVGVWNTVAKQ
jgi:hypothetical protein